MLDRVGMGVPHDQRSVLNNAFVARASEVLRDRGIIPIADAKDVVSCLGKPAVGEGLAFIKNLSGICSVVSAGVDTGA